MTTAPRPAQDTFESVRAPGPITAPSAPADRRRHGIEELADGRLIDRDVERMLLDQLDRRAPQRARITRLSLSDPASLAIAGELAARSGR